MTSTTGKDGYPGKQARKQPEIPTERCPAHRYHDPNKGLHNGTFELVAAMIKEKLQGDELQE